MSLKKLGLAISAAVVGVVAVGANGCSSSGGNSNGPAAGDGGSEMITIHHLEAGASSSGGSGGGSSGAGSSGSGGSSGGEAGMPGGFDGTTGKPCTADSQCQAGAAVNVCSNKYTFNVTNLHVELWPTPVCIPAIPNGGGGNCDPCGGTTCSPNQIFGCDSADLDPTTSPGLCLPLNQMNPVAGQGVCIPRCSVPLDGSTPTGCTGKDTCVAFTWLLTTSGAIQGIGFCQGSCQQNSDCSSLGSGFICQTDIGFCVQETAPAARAKALGAACTNTDSTMGTCDCEFNTMTNNGYCTAACVVGGNPCASGYICDAFYPSGPLMFGGDVTEPALTGQNKGVVGNCIQPCTHLDGGTGPDGGPQCPPNSTCQAVTLAGPDCLP
jgi:hypothetical protein